MNFVGMTYYINIFCKSCSKQDPILCDVIGLADVVMGAIVSSMQPPVPTRIHSKATMHTHHDLEHASRLEDNHGLL